MRVSNDNTVIQLLRRAVVVGVCVDKVTGLQILDVHREGEILIGSELTIIGREDDLRGRHASRGDKVSVYDTVAASIDELLAIGERLSRTEADEVVRRRERRRLPSDGGILTIGLASGTDDRRIERQRVLGVRAVSSSAVAGRAVSTSGVAGVAVTPAVAVTTVTSVVVITTSVVIAARTLVLVAKISLVTPIVGTAPFDR